MDNNLKNNGTVGNSAESQGANGKNSGKSAFMRVFERSGAFSRVGAFLLNHVVTLLFVLFVAAGLFASKDLSFGFFVNELLARFFRNAFLVMALIIPVLAGLGLNFGIVVGALAGMLAIIFVRFFEIGGLFGLALCFLLALPLAVLFGFATGKLYNKTRGQEMIASLIVGYFADGLYQFVILFAIGVIIPVSAAHPMILPDGIGFKATFDMGPHPDQIRDPAIQIAGLKYALDWIWRAPFLPALIALSLCMLAFLVIRRMAQKWSRVSGEPVAWAFWLSCFLCAALAGVGAYGALAPGSFLSEVREIPAATGIVIFALCLFTIYFTRTKLGQDCRSVGQDQNIAKVSGIDVDRTRIIATIISTVLAAWGMIIYLQNMGTVSTYTSHRQIGMFSVASLLVGGASTSKASVKNALAGVLLFNAMFIVSPSIGSLFSGNEGVGEYTRSFMVYGVIGLALGLYIWKGVKAAGDKAKLD